jgi:hypothetical protein
MYFTLPQDGFSKPEHVAVYTVLYKKNLVVTVPISSLNGTFFALSYSLIKYGDGFISPHSNGTRMNGGKHPGFLR